MDWFSISYIPILYKFEQVETCTQRYRSPFWDIVDACLIIPRV